VEFIPWDEKWKAFNVTVWMDTTKIEKTLGWKAHHNGTLSSPLLSSPLLSSPLLSSPLLSLHPPLLSPSPSPLSPSHYEIFAVIEEAKQIYDSWKEYNVPAKWY
jgi:hypothetical protein